MYYDSLQKGKEISWDELYRAEFGIIGLQHKNVGLDLVLETSHFFTDSHIQLKTIQVDARIKPSLALTAGSKLHGFGSDFKMDRQPGLMRGYESYCYQQMRMNSLSIRYLSDNILSNVSFDLGGNAHNQLSAILSADLQLNNLQLGFSQEFRTLDNHWRTPITISGVTLEARHKDISFKTVAALGLLPEYESTISHHELFVQSELEYHFSEASLLALATSIKDQNYAAKKNRRYQVRVEQELGNKILVTPLTELNDIDGNRLWNHRFLVNYCALPGCEVGVYYDYSHFEASNGRHSLGVSLAFGLDLLIPDRRL